MLQPIKHILQNKNIVLASSSPRRKEMLENIGLKITLCPSNFEENLDPNSFARLSEFVEETALGKAEEVAKRIGMRKYCDGDLPSAADMIIAADTVVALNDTVFGKPKNEVEAFEILRSLSGRGHVVYTGVVVKCPDKIIRFTEETNVFFGNLDDDQIRSYIQTGEPMDKAGGYGIQGVAGSMVERIEGDYFTVVGLPLYRLCKVIYDLYK